MSANIVKTSSSELVEKPPACVGDLMTSELVLLSPHDTLADAACLMATRHVDHILVVDDSGELVGTISYSDILYAAAYRPKPQLEEVQHVMTRKPITVKYDTPLSTAVSKMNAKPFHCLPVLSDDGAVCGLITHAELLKSYHIYLEVREK